MAGFARTLGGASFPPVVPVVVIGVASVAGAAAPMITVPINRNGWYRHRVFCIRRGVIWASSSGVRSTLGRRSLAVWTNLHVRNTPPVALRYPEFLTCYPYSSIPSSTPATKRYPYLPSATWSEILYPFGVYVRVQTEPATSMLL